MLTEYVKNTHASTHQQYELEVTDVSVRGLGPRSVFVHVWQGPGEIVVLPSPFFVPPSWEGPGKTVVSKYMRMPCKQKLWKAFLEEIASRMCRYCHYGQQRKKFKHLFVFIRSLRWSAMAKPPCTSHSKSFTIASYCGMVHRTPTTLEFCLRGCELHLPRLLRWVLVKLENTQVAQNHHARPTTGSPSNDVCFQIFLNLFICLWVTCGIIKILFMLQTGYMFGKGVYFAGERISLRSSTKATDVDLTIK